MSSDILSEEPYEHHPIDSSRFEPLGETRAFRHLTLKTKAELDQVLPALVGAGVLAYVGNEDPSTLGVGPWYYCNGVGWYSLGSGGPLWGHDYIIDQNWAAKVAAGQGAEGQEIGTVTGFSTKVYSTLTGACDDARIEGLAGRDNKSFFVVPGITSSYTPATDYTNPCYWEFSSSMRTPAFAGGSRIYFNYTGINDYVRFTFRNLYVGNSTFSGAGSNELRFYNCQMGDITFYNNIHIQDCDAGILTYDSSGAWHAYVAGSHVARISFKRLGRGSFTNNRIDGLTVTHWDHLVIDGNTIGSNNADPPIYLGRPNVGGVTQGPLIITDNSIIRREQAAHNDAIQIDGKSNNFLDVKICDNINDEQLGASLGANDHIIHLIGGTVHRATIHGNHWGKYPLVAIKTDVDGTWLDLDIAHNIPSTVGLEVPGAVDDRTRGILYVSAGLNLGFNTFSVRFDNIILDIAGSTILLPASQTSYVEVNSAGTVSSNTTGYTLGRIPLGQAVTDATDITSITEEGVHLDQQATGEVGYIPLGSAADGLPLAL